MNKAFEMIFERLEDELTSTKTKCGTNVDFDKGICKSQEIVHEVAEEYNNGWIACSYRLPEIGQEVIVATKNGSVYSNIYYDYIDNNAKEPCFHRWDDEMWNCFMLDVIAWQPLPKPFKERD